MKKKLLHFAIVVLGMLITTPSFSQTAGTLTFKFTSPLHTSGNYRADGHYVVAVWIESCTPCGTTAGTSTFVKTKLRYVGNGTSDHLPTWASKSGGSSSNALGTSCSVVDATTGATTGTFTAQTVTWNGTNVGGTLVADGSYRVAIQETWGHNSATATRYFPFTKGTAVDNQTPTADTNFTALSLVWQPTLTTEAFSSNPDAVVYPNPSKGIFNIDFKNEATNIKVVDILGKVVYSQKLDSVSIGTTKTIDLTSFQNGVYIVNISNDKGSSDYKIILDK